MKDIFSCERLLKKAIIDKKKWNKVDWKNFCKNVYLLILQTGTVKNSSSRTARNQPTPHVGSDERPKSSIPTGTAGTGEKGSV